MSKESISTTEEEKAIREEETKELIVVEEEKGEDHKEGDSDSGATTTKEAMMDPTKDQVTAQFKLMLLILMVLQNSSVVLVGRYERSTKPREDLFDVSHLVLVTEAVKFVLASILEFFHTNGKLFKSIKENIFDHPVDALKISIPALLYLIQNTLLYIALSNLSAPLFQVTYQSKLVTTAVVSVIMLARKYSTKQWICLVCLSIGVAIVVLGEKSSNSNSSKGADDTEKEEDADADNRVNLMLGLICITIACFCSAFAGVYFEKVLKKAPNTTANHNEPPKAPVSMWMRNIQLAFFSIVIAVAKDVLTTKPKDDDPNAAPTPFLHGFSFLAWTLVALQAGGGLLVAAVIKYADNVLKGLATGVSVVASSAFSILFFGTALQAQFAVGSAMILLAVYLFSNDLPACCRTKEKREDSLPK